MRLGIYGDSFAHTYNGSWLESIVKEFNFEVVNHVGLRGHSQYAIVKEYKSHVLLNDIVICFYTEHSRLYHPRYQITASNIITDNYDIKSAAEQYYNHLYQEDYSEHVHNLLAREVQSLCRTTKSLLINIPCFEHEHLEKFYGMWYCAPNGLVECSKMDADWDSFHDSRINHFTPKAHEILYNDIKLHIDYYLKNRYDYNFISLNPQIFA